MCLCVANDVPERNPACCTCNILVGDSLPKMRFHDRRYTAASLVLNHGYPWSQPRSGWGTANRASPWMYVEGPFSIQDLPDLV